MPTLLSVFGVEPNRIGGTETFARELSLQLADRGWKSVLCFEKAPPPAVAKFLELPNVTVEVLANPTEPNWNATKRLAALLRQYKPEMLHLHFIGFIGLYPWLAKVLSTKKIFFTDHSSRPTGYVPARAPFWKRLLVRLINYPITKVICVSKYGLHCMRALDVLDDVRYELVYNGVDLSRVVQDPVLGKNFRDRYQISSDKKVVVQVSWIIPEKGIGQLLDVAKRVKTNGANAQFLIVGDGPYR
ncbi:MAG TPA: glycosyltransferase family 4 protein, partial [Pyrinomonadaceae bacterium]